ncbi:amidohydrolase family protein [Roseomonas sp. BN140053]|uniref:amidohydrolase family protein n=1 Tax=Roseomonas sp. BN140053 TaxID=3391898 RepID=UPI0039ED9733
MSAVLNEADRPRNRDARPTVVDCDVHPAMRSRAELLPFLSQRWRDHMRSFGARAAQPLVGEIPWPRMTVGNGSRLDAFPPDGGPPASDLDFLRTQLLDGYGVEHGILQPLSAGAHTLDLELGAALCSATNDWQLEKWVRPEPRLHASLCVPQEHPDAAVREIERRAADPAFVQVEMKPRTIEPVGRRRYWPIYEAAAAAGLPVGFHSAAFGPHSNSGGGWLSFYIEEHYAFASSLQAVVVSLVMEGVFERFPTLKVVCVEGGFAWAPALAWRLDKHWERMRAEVPQVKRPPSEYIREHIWYTTQPVEEPEVPDHLRDTAEWIGWDRLMFSTDYPHWDFDDPRYAFKMPMSQGEKEKIFRGNARSLYRLD